MVGIDGGHEGPLDVSRIPLSFVNQLYLPPTDYTAADALPDEWVEVLPDLN
jgi:hypothetical protein